MGDDYFHVDKDREVARCDPFPNRIWKFGQAMNDPNPGTRRRTVFKACENDENVLIQNKVPCGTVGTVGS